VKGGRLAAAAGGARDKNYSLPSTDVPAEQESALASGPSLPDPSTIADVERILAEFKMLQQFPPALRRCVEEGKIRETPKEADPVFRERVFCVAAGDGRFISSRAFSRRRQRDFFTCCDNSTDDWPVEKAAADLLEQLSAAASCQSQPPGGNHRGWRSQLACDWKKGLAEGILRLCLRAWRISWVAGSRC